MNALTRTLGLAGALALLATGVHAAEPAAASSAPPPQTIMLKVAVGADGKVQTATPVDAQAPLNQVAAQYAQKLVFTPARKDGAAVPSETHLSLTLALEPAGEGKFGLKLKRAINGPGVAVVGKMEPPKYQGRRGGATVVVAVDVDAQGVPDVETMKPEKVELRDQNAFAEARYLDATRMSLRGTRLIPDKVAGLPVASRVSLPYRFGAGGSKPKPGEEDDRRGRPPTPADPAEMPAMQAVSSVPNIELPRIDYKAPAAN